MSMWIVYCQPEGKNPAMLISIESSIAAAHETVARVSEHVLNQGWDSLPVAVREIAPGFNYLIAGSAGPLVLL